MDYDRVKGFSALVSRYLMIDLGSFLASHKSILSSKPPSIRGHHPSGNPLMYLLDRGRTEKVVTFLNNISQTKQVMGP
jgi:hypothetical protein